MKKILLLLAVVVVSLTIKAQNVGIGTTAPVARLHVTDSSVIFSAPEVIVPPSGFYLPVSGAGSRFLWLPRKGALRAGTVSGTQWDADSIGTWSIAMGTDVIAKGDYATSIGLVTSATGTASVAMGSGSTASGFISTAIGNNPKATGSAAVSIGSLTNASSTYSFATGYQTNAGSHTSFSIGRFNDTISTASKNTWVATDPLFYIGNGTANNARHNAMVVYKNGNLVLKNASEVTISPAGFTVPVSGPGTRMMWLPEKGALRAGTVSGTQWDADSIGTWSIAMGTDVIAKGDYATSFGLVTSASGTASVAMGSGSIASGFISTAIGNNPKATGSAAVSIGSLTNASSTYSFATGYQTNAGSHTSFSIGRFNDTISTASKTTWVATDPLFYIGNGTANNARNNAMVVYKNGNMDVSGYTQLGNTTESAPAIKMKKLTLPSAAAQGALTTVLHGLNRSKIISFTAMLDYGAGDIPPGYTDVAGYEYNIQTTATTFNVYTRAGNSVNILSKPVKVLIIYEE